MSLDWDKESWTAIELKIFRIHGGCLKYYIIHVIVISYRINSLKMSANFFVS